VIPDVHLINFTCLALEFGPLASQLLALRAALTAVISVSFSMYSRLFRQVSLGNIQRPTSILILQLREFWRIYEGYLPEKAGQGKTTLNETKIPTVKPSA